MANFDTDVNSFTSTETGLFKKNFIQSFFCLFSDFFELFQFRTKLVGMNCKRYC